MHYKVFCQGDHSQKLDTLPRIKVAAASAGLKHNALCVVLPLKKECSTKVTCAPKRPYKPKMYAGTPEVCTTAASHLKSQQHYTGKKTWVSLEIVIVGFDKAFPTSGKLSSSKIYTMAELSRLQVSISLCDSPNLGKNG